MADILYQEASKAMSANRDELRLKAKDIIQHHDILSLFGESVHACGFVGDTRQAELLYLVFNTRFFERPSSVIVKGDSAGGKSYLVNSVLKFMPTSGYELLSGMSEKAIIYWDANLKHKHLVVQEMAGLSGDAGLCYLRTLLSEGCISYVVTEKNNEGKLQTRRVKKDGPTGLVMTTTTQNIHPEDASRLLALQVDDSEEQSRRVLYAQAAEAAGVKRSSDFNFEMWHSFGDWLASGPLEVIVPEQLGKLIVDGLPANVLRLKRDFPQFLALMMAHAVLHQATREKDDRGRILVNNDDYAAVLLRVEDAFVAGARKAVKGWVVAVVKAVAELGPQQKPGETVTITAVAERLDVDVSTASRHVTAACEMGFIQNRSRSSGYDSDLVLGRPLPFVGSSFPKPSELSEKLK